MKEKLNQEELNILKVVEKAGFIKFEIAGGVETAVLYEYSHTRKNKWKESSRFTDWWDLRVLCKRLEESEYIEKLKEIRQYPALGKFFYEPTKKFIKEMKKEYAKKRTFRMRRRNGGLFIGGLSGRHMSDGGWDEADNTGKIYSPIPTIPNLSFMEASQ